MKFIYAQKLKMTRVFDQDGKSIATTMVRALPCIIEGLRTAEKEKYNAVIVKALRKSVEATQKTERVAKIGEFRLENVSDYKKGDKVTLEQFADSDIVEVTGTGKGKGFAGTIKRHGFKRGPESHGGNNVREPGSIGAQQPQRVVLGRRMAGHMGTGTVTVKNLKVMAIDSKEGIMLISGALPGPAKGILRIISR